MIYQKLSLYMCREALDLLDRLPADQQSSGWVQQQVGRAHFELADYKQVSVFGLHSSKSQAIYPLGLPARPTTAFARCIETSLIAWLVSTCTPQRCGI